MTSSLISVFNSNELKISFACLPFLLIFKTRFGTSLKALFDSPKFSKFFFILPLLLIYLPVYLHNSNSFFISPDSQGWLRSPAENASYRPPLLWLFYRIFVDQKIIDDFFEKNKNFGVAISGDQSLQVPINISIILYLFSLIALLVAVRMRFGVSPRLIYIFAILQVSGEFWFGHGYFFVPTSTLPVYLTLLYLLILIEISDVIRSLSYQVLLKSRIQYVLGILAYLALILVASQNSFIVDEINYVMSETLTITLVNLTLTLFICVLTNSRKSLNLPLIFILGIFIGAIFTARLATLFIGILLLFITLVHLRRRIEFKKIAVVFLVSIAIPTLLLKTLDLDSKQSQTWYGPVAYGIEFQVIEPKKLNLSSDAKKLLDEAIAIRMDLLEKSNLEKPLHNLIFEPTGISLYGAAIPAANALGFNSGTNAQMNSLFKEIAIASWSNHPTLVLKMLKENLLVSFGLYKNPNFPHFLKFGSFVGISKILTSPLSYILVLVLILLTLRKRSPNLTQTMIFLLLFIFLGNSLVIATFNGPIVRYASLVDPYVLLAVTLLYSLHRRKEVENHDLR